MIMEIKNLTFEPKKNNGGISANFELGEVRYFAENGSNEGEDEIERAADAIADLKEML